MPRVTVELRVGECKRLCRREALVLPLSEPGVRRLDVRVAELLKDFGSKRRTDTHRTHRDDLCVLIRQPRARLHLQKASRNVNRTGNVPLSPLVLFAHIDEDQLLARVEAVL